MTAGSRSPDNQRDRQRFLARGAAILLSHATRFRFFSTRADLRANVRYWPKADMTVCTAHVRFWGVKQTSACTNRVEFFYGSTSVGFITGADLTNANRNPPQDPATGQSWVVLSPLVGSWTSVVFSSSINAFEFTSRQPGCFGREGGTGTPAPGPPVCGLNPQTPLPAALPLFATGLGALGLLGWRRNRKPAAV